MCTGSASFKSYYNINLLVRGQYHCGAISFKMAAMILFIKRKQFPSNLGECDHGNDVSLGNHRILDSKLAMVICICAVRCSRKHYRFIMKRRLLLKALSGRSRKTFFFGMHMFYIIIYSRFIFPNHQRDPTKLHSK